MLAWPGGLAACAVARTSLAGVRAHRRVRDPQTVPATMPQPRCRADQPSSVPTEQKEVTHVTALTARRVAALVGASRPSLVALAGLQHARRHRASPTQTSRASRDDTVTIGTHTPLTGPAAAGYSSISAAATAYFDYLNDNGGINGRTHRVHRQGRRLQPGEHRRPSCASWCRRTRSSRSSTASARRPTPRCSTTSTRTRCPTCSSRRASTSWNQPEKYPYTFGFNADYVVEGAALAQYAADEHPGQGVCLLGQDDDFGDEIIEGAELALGADGLAHVAALLGVEPGRHRADRRDARRPAARSTSSRPSTASRRSRSAPPRSWDGSRSGSRRRRAPTTRRSSATSARTSGPSCCRASSARTTCPPPAATRSGCTLFQRDQRRVQRRRAVRRQHGLRHERRVPVRRGARSGGREPDARVADRRDRAPANSPATASFRCPSPRTATRRTSASASPTVDKGVQDYVGADLRASTAATVRRRRRASRWRSRARASPDA